MAGFGTGSGIVCQYRTAYAWGDAGAGVIFGAADTAAAAGAGFGAAEPQAGEFATVTTLLMHAA
jgi:hypothetical protein